MKNLFIILLIVFVSCQKTADVTHEKAELLVCENTPPAELVRAQLEKENIAVSLRGKPDSPGGKPRKPKPTPDPEPEPDPDPTPDPPPTNPPATSGTVCILADFDGDLNNTSDWYNYHPTGQPFYTPASTLTEAKIELALSVMNFDYSKYKVVITRDEFTYNNFLGLKMRVVFTDRHWDVNRFNTTGLSYVGTLNTSGLSRSYVFTGALMSSGEWAGKIGTHESGHAFGLSHQKAYNPDGTLINSYRTGCNMGQCYYEQGYWINGLTWWPDGWQDDNAVLTRIAGLR